MEMTGSDCKALREPQNRRKRMEAYRLRLRFATELCQ
jgi:hypothetical protein